MKQFFVICFLWWPLVSWAGPKIVILGDIEGDGPRFENFLRMSGAFIQTPQGVRIRPGYHFIFMGDTIDRGSAAMKIIDTLNDLKRHQPDQMTTLMGNRDINKLALRSKFAVEISQGLSQDKDYTEPIESLKRFLERINAPRAFEYRRQELSNFATDKDVFISMLQDVMPGGRILEYLMSAKIAHIDPESGGIFVHGAISELSMGRVPGDSHFYEDTEEWTQKLNRWAQNLPEELLDYQRPLPETPKMNRKSLVYDRFSEGDGNPNMPTQNVQDYLKRNGLSYLVAGHTPYGDVPVVMANEGFKVILVDNSYASHQKASITRIEQGEIHLTGYLSDLGVFKARVSIQGPSKFGHLQEGYRILGELGSGETVAWRVDPGFKSEYKVLPPVAPSCRRLTGPEKQ